VDVAFAVATQREMVILNSMEFPPITDEERGDSCGVMLTIRGVLPSVSS